MTKTKPSRLAREITEMAYAQRRLGVKGEAVRDEALEHWLSTEGVTAYDGVVCGRGRNPTLRFRPSVFAGEIDVLPAERRDMGQEIGR
jgi:hypothetical protein